MARRSTRSPVTANTVARAAGVSRSAVSRTFTPGASVSDKTRARVEAAASELGYRPNLIARSLINQRSNIIGLAVGYMSNQFYPSLIEALCERLAAQGKKVLLFPVSNTGESDPQIEDILRYQVDALILASARLSSRLASECRRIGVPVILLNRVTLDTNCDTICGDNETGGHAIGQFLAANGYQRPAFMAGLADSSTSRDRERGFKRALDAAGLPLHAREQGDYDFSSAQDAMRRLLARPDRPDAVFCANDHMAFAAHEIAQQAFGLKVGRDIALVGFDDVEMASWPSFALTTYSQSSETMARLAVELLEQESDEPRHINIPGELIVRSSAPACPDLR